MSELSLQIMSNQIRELNYLLEEMKKDPAQAASVIKLREIKNTLTVLYSQEGGTSWMGNA